MHAKMNKKELLKQWLLKMQGYHEGKEPVADKLYKDGFKQIIDYLERNGYEKTKEWLDVRKSELSKGSDSRLRGMLEHLYNQTKSKMWSIERKEAKT